jgi:hypothetical protein
MHSTSPASRQMINEMKMTTNARTMATVFWSTYRHFDTNENEADVRVAGFGFATLAKYLLTSGNAMTRRRKEEKMTQIVQQTTTEKSSFSRSVGLIFKNILLQVKGNTQARRAKKNNYIDIVLILETLIDYVQMQFNYLLNVFFARPALQMRGVKCK